MKKQITFDPAKYENLGATIIAYEIAIVSILDTLAKTMPATAQAVAKEMARNRDRIPGRKFPNVREKIDTYVELIETTLKERPQ